MGTEVASRLQTCLVEFYFPPLGFVSKEEEGRDVVCEARAGFRQFRFSGKYLWHLSNMFVFVWEVSGNRSAYWFPGVILISGNLYPPLEQQ